jgi:hypothetical protein
VKRQKQSVADEQMRQAFEECGGRATPPNRLDEILKRAADEAGVQPGNLQANPFKAGKLWAAALLLLGLGTTITASVMKDQADDAAAKQQVLATSVGVDQPIIGIDPAQAAETQLAGTQVGSTQVASTQVASTPMTRSQDPKPTPKPTPKPPAKQAPKPADKSNNKALPQGTDPADLAVIRSAEAMLEAEKNLRKLMKDGKIAGVDQVLPFDQLGGWKYTEALEGMPDKVRALDGKKVLMLGFMLPIDEVQNIKEFLLVESLWSCCYGEPPDINGLVRCVMPKGKTIDYQFDPMKLVGTMEIEATTMDGYCVDIYQLHVDYVEVIEAAKPKNAEPTKEEVKKLENVKRKQDAKRAKGNDC